MHARLVRLAVSIAFALGAAGASRVEAQGGRLLTRLPGFDRDVVLDTLVFSHEALNAPAAIALTAVREVFATLRLPKPMADSLRGAVFNTQFSATSQLAGERMSTYMRCGVGASGENSDYFRVTMAIATYVETLPDGKSRIGTGFAGGARDMGGSGKSPVPCASTGLFEARIAKMVKEKLAKS